MILTSTSARRRPWSPRTPARASRTVDSRDARSTRPEGRGDRVRRVRTWTLTRPGLPPRSWTPTTRCRTYARGSRSPTGWSTSTATRWARCRWVSQQSWPRWSSSSGATTSSRRGTCTTGGTRRDGSGPRRPAGRRARGRGRRRRLDVGEPLQAAGRGGAAAAGPAGPAHGGGQLPGRPLHRRLGRRPAGLTVRRVDPREVDGVLDPDVGVVSFSHVDYRTGRAYDMAAVTRAVHEAGALTVWDLSHSAGALPVDLDGSGADFAVGCGYKYLNGGPGCPAYAMAARRHHDTMTSPLAGWTGHARPFEMEGTYDPRPASTGSAAARRRCCRCSPSTRRWTRSTGCRWPTCGRGACR